MAGKVFLIGAGPGDPGLITLKGIRCLERADVVAYDSLASPRLLRHVRAAAERIYVGKRGGDHAVPQEEINRLIIARAREGKVVARLKGGDPFIFGRGGEEAEELAAAGIPFEVVPGVTSAIAAPAYAGIPLTHRDFASSVAFITGHEDPTKPEPAIAWDKLATGAETLVFFMGVSNLGEIVAQLVRHGRPPETPAAAIRWGTRPDQEVVTGTLADIQEKARGLKPPAIIVVGGVVGLRERLGWFERKPLFGRRIVVTRAREQASAFAELLEEAGAEVIEVPAIAIEPPESFAELDAAIARLHEYHWIVFTSTNGVAFFRERLGAAGKDLRDLHGVRVAAIGPATADVLVATGIRPDLVPGEYRAEALVEALGRGDLAGLAILIPRAAEAREVLPAELRRRGARVDVVPAYRTVRAGGDTEDLIRRLGAGTIDAVTFTSSSTVTNFLDLLKGEDAAALLREVAVASIGPITAETARARGLSTQIMPEEYTIPALVGAIVRYFERPR